MIVFCGLGFFEEQVLKYMGDKNITIIEQNPQKAATIAEQYKNFNVITGDASSILVWKKLPLDQIKHVITAFRDSDISYEICLFVRKTFKLEIPILVILYDIDGEEKFSEFGVNVINPLDISINLVLNKLDKNYSRAIDVGIRKGEIVELNILSKSHLTDRKLKHINPSNWKVAALYRNNEIIIPTGETVLKTGDKVVLFGEPKVIENLVNIFLKGIPQFPLQYGKSATFYVNQKIPHNIVEEAFNLVRCTRATGVTISGVGFEPDKKYFEEIRKNLELTKDIDFKISDSVYRDINQTNNGINLFHMGRGISSRFKIKQILSETIKPSVFLKGAYPHSKILSILNSPDMGHALEIGMELSRLWNVPLEAIYVTMPKELRSESDDKNLKKVQDIVGDFISIYKRDIPLIIKEGNPIKEVMKFMKQPDNWLVVVGYERFNTGSFFNPSTGYLMAVNSRHTTITIPQSAD